MTEAAVRLFLHELEPLLPVDVPGGVENAVRPEGHGLVAAATGETDALLDEAGPETEPGDKVVISAQDGELTFEVVEGATVTGGAA